MVGRLGGHTKDEQAAEGPSGSAAEQMQAAIVQSGSLFFQAYHPNAYFPLLGTSHSQIQKLSWGTSRWVQGTHESRLSGDTVATLQATAWVGHCGEWSGMRPAAVLEGLRAGPGGRTWEAPRRVALRETLCALWKCMGPVAHGGARKD